MSISIVEDEKMLAVRWVGLWGCCVVRGWWSLVVEEGECGGGQIYRQASRAAVTRRVAPGGRWNWGGPRHAHADISEQRGSFMAPFLFYTSKTIIFPTTVSTSTPSIFASKKILASRHLAIGYWVGGTERDLSGKDHGAPLMGWAGLSGFF
jgi:hypothetical protein